MDGLSVIDHARRYLAMGISVFPVARSEGGKEPAQGWKAPTVQWSRYQARQANANELRKWWGHNAPLGIAAVCGKGSQGLEVIDFDRDSATIFPEWGGLVEDVAPGLLGRLCVVASPRGRHVWYRSEEVEGTQKLAEDQSATGKERTLIETRAEGGYCLLPGTPAECHETGKPYLFQGPALWDVADTFVISAEDRQVLLDCGRSFERPVVEAVPFPKLAAAGASADEELKPGTDFDLRGDWGDILTPHGWALVCRRGDVEYWRRPGKKLGVSATVGHCKGSQGEPLIHVFSSSCHPLEMGKTYGRFRALAALAHGGDLSAAAKELGGKGYGKGKKTKAGFFAAKAQGGATHAPPSPEAANKRKEERAAGRGLKTLDLNTLLALELPEPRWAVPGILPEGLSILAGKPKLGKSWLALNLAITIACGGKALGDVVTQPGDVLYLALEDRERRLQSRARKVLAGLGVNATSRLHFATECPRLDHDGLGWVEDWIEEHPDARLVIIDVWSRFRTPPKNKGSAYDEDYEMMTMVKQLADRRSISIVVIHHCRKGQGGQPEDILDEISGTQGIAGCADTPMVLARTRGDYEATLVVDGRDVGRQELALKFDPETCCWTSLGSAEQHTASKTREAIMKVFRNSGGATVTAKQMAELIGVADGTVRKEMYRMWQDGALTKKGHGYTWPLQGPDDAA